MPPRPNAEQLTAINMTFSEFLMKHKCVALEGFLRLAMTAQGYGIPELMPALYGLWWVTPELLINTLEVHVPGMGQPADDAERWVRQNLADDRAKEQSLGDPSCRRAGGDAQQKRQML